MTQEQVKENPVYMVEEEDEEETVTIDFENETIYQKEEHLIVKGNINGTSIITADTAFAAMNSIGEPIPFPTAPVEPPKPTFKDEMNDFLLNTITSKAIASLMEKRFTLDKEIDKLLQGQRMGELGNVLSDEIGTALYEKRTELRKCYVGSEVKYDRIPDWAKSYIKEYTKDMIHGLTVLIDE